MRYPGGKGKLARRIVKSISSFFETYVDYEYREPFAGALAIGRRIIPKVTAAWINDIDYGMYAFWKSVRDCPEELLSHADKFVPTTNRFYEFKAYLLDIPVSDKHVGNVKDAEIGFKKLAIHQISYSGLGTKSGGPLGGEKQESDYKIDCRWSAAQVRKEVMKFHKMARGKSLIVTCFDFHSLFEDRSKAFLYLDPPYYVKGPELYQHSFTSDDHERLAAKLRQTEHPWLLSYDDCTEIRGLYHFAVVKEVPLNYTINGSTTKTELLIAPKDFSSLLDETIYYPVLEMTMDYEAEGNKERIHDILDEVMDMDRESLDRPGVCSSVGIFGEWFIGQAAVIIQDNKVLIGKRKGSTEPGTWSLPGGHLEYGESFFDGLQREVLEETGITISRFKFLTVTNDLFGQGHPHYVTLFYHVLAWSGEPTLKEPDKCEEWAFVSWKDLPLNLFTPMKNFMEQKKLGVFSL